MKSNISRVSIKFGLTVILVVLFLIVSFLIQIQNKEINFTTSQNQQQSPTTAQKQESFSYKGEEGENALDLLKSKAKIEQDKSGLVVSINERRANPSVREYWAFYVNKKLSQIGPSDYQTKNRDVIEWKIEKY